jgi:hypothetical protein
MHFFDMIEMASFPAQDKNRVDNILYQTLGLNPLLNVLLQSKHLFMILFK